MTGPRRLREAYGIEVTATAVAAAQRAETLVIAVKPQDMAALLEEIAPVIPAGPAGDLGRGRHPHRVHRGAAARRDVPVVRVMSNTPVLVDEAMSVISAGRARGRGAPAPDRGTAEPGRQGAADPRVPAGRRHRAVRQRPRLRVLPGRGDGRRRHPARHGARQRAGNGQAGRVRRGHHAARLRRAPGDPARGGDLARAGRRSARSGNWSGTASARRSWPRSRPRGTAAANSAPARAVSESASERERAGCRTSYRWRSFRRLHGGASELHEIDVPVRGGTS